ncbi:MAG: AzlC family ABC transporter permease [Lachnospiraceae bacterium]|nr:AzlC family ABC transporter permease [Lachnospiraceae bacterium]
MEEQKITTTNEFLCGAKDSTPIAIGYLSVSFTFGIMAAKAGFSPWVAGLISLVNVTSAGQFAGLQLMIAGTTYVEMFLTQLVINLRYALMSLSLTQKLSRDCHTIKRLVMAFGVTDEIFAVSVSRNRPVTFPYMLGLEIPPILCWAAGSVLGGIANNLLPASVQSALGLALYAMFIAIVMPPARKNPHIAIVAGIALTISCILRFVPVLKQISSGFAIIICTVVAAGIGALLFPVENAQGGDS